MAEVQYREASRIYAGTDIPAVNRLSIDIADGELLVVVGPSGSGKSTALRMLAGLEFIDSDAVYIGDRNVTLVPPKDRDIAMVFQKAMAQGHRVAVLGSGNLQQVAAPRDLYVKPANRFVAGFIGSPAMNLIDVTASDGLKLGGQTVPVTQDVQADIGANEKVTVGVRPEHLTLVSTSPTGGIPGRSRRSRISVPRPSPTSRSNMRTRRRCWLSGPTVNRICGEGTTYGSVSSGRPTSSRSTGHGSASRARSSAARS